MLSSARQRNVNPRIFIQKNVRVTARGTEPEHCIIFNILKRLIPLRSQPFCLGKTVQNARNAPDGVYKILRKVRLMCSSRAFMPLNGLCVFNLC